MLVDGTPYRTIWVAEDGWRVAIIDQTGLPHALRIARLATCEDAALAIERMQVRGAPLIGATAAYGLCLALREDASDEAIDRACERLLRTRPTAANLGWALNEMRAGLRGVPRDRRVAAAYGRAAAICEDDVAVCRAIGEHGLPLIRRVLERRGGDGAVNILTHCNAGWLACVDLGTALSPVYMAHDQGLAVHVWVNETRPRNQGAALTAWELGGHGVPHTLIPDGAGGHLMQRGLVDLCITGTDRTTAAGDVGNKIGTYPQALAAQDNRVPFYVALPHASIDWTIHDGLEGIPIEQRDAAEVTHVTGLSDDGSVVSVRLAPEGAQAANYAFDVTPARLVTGLITERGVCPASAEGLLGLYPERRRSS